MEMMPWTCLIAEVNWRTRMEELPLLNRKHTNTRFSYGRFVGGKSQPCIDRGKTVTDHYELASPRRHHTCSTTALSILSCSGLLWSGLLWTSSDTRVSRSRCASATAAMSNAAGAVTLLVLCAPASSPSCDNPRQYVKPSSYRKFVGTLLVGAAQSVSKTDFDRRSK
jgi:hypothetical protein